MTPSSVMYRPAGDPASTSHVAAERPGPGVLGQIIRAGVLAVLVAAALGAPGRGSTSATEPETPLTPARQLVELPFQPFVDPAPASEVDAEQPAGQVAPRQVAPRQVAPVAPTADAPSGGDTNVTYDNGSNDVNAGSGGSSVNNDANLHTRAGVETSEEPEEEPAGP
jgi:hypothetical protein